MIISMKKINLDESLVKKMYLIDLMTIREISNVMGVSAFPVAMIIKGSGIARNNTLIRDVKKHILNKISKTDKGCWEYPYCIQSNGYARLKGKYAHRLSYEAFVSKIPKGLTIDHLCKNKICVNPDHMEPVTASENVKRSNAASAVNARKTHCMRGHPFEGHNLFMSQGKRQCRICDNKRQLARYYKRKAVCS